MDKEKKILNARSRENGIVLLSSKFPSLCYEAYIDENGEVKTGIIPTMVGNIRDFGDFVSRDEKKYRKVEFYCKAVFLILAILSVILTKNVSIALALLYFSMIALKDTIELCESVWGLKFGKYKSTARFHSAEHMSINAYEKKQGIPTMEEIKKASRFDKNCSSRKPINKVLILGLLAVVVSVSAFVEMYVYLILVALLFIFSYFQQKYNICTFLQILVTNKPTEKELKVALAGIEYFDKMEEKLPDTGCPMGGMILAIHIYDGDGEEEGGTEN